MKQKTEEQRKGDYDYEVKVYENAKPGTMVLKVSTLLLKQPVVKTKKKLIDVWKVRF